LPFVDVGSEGEHLVYISGTAKKPQIFHRLIDCLLDYLFVRGNKKAAGVGRGVKDTKFEDSFDLHERHAERVIHLEITKFWIHPRIESVLDNDAA